MSQLGRLEPFQQIGRPSQKGGQRPFALGQDLSLLGARQLLGGRKQPGETDSSRQGWKQSRVCVTMVGTCVEGAADGASARQPSPAIADRGSSMTQQITRRQFQSLLGWRAASIAAGEFGLSRQARAEENFTVASTGATWGEGLRASFVDAPKFEEKIGAKVTQEFAIDSVFTAKAMASCGTPPFSTVAVLQAEANFLALGGCLEDYNLDTVTDYKDIVDSAKEPPRGQLKNWFAPFVLIVMGLVYK